MCLCVTWAERGRLVSGVFGADDNKGAKIILNGMKISQKSSLKRITAS
jgi:hypothetical protein